MEEKKSSSYCSQLVRVLCYLRNFYIVLSGHVNWFPTKLLNDTTYDTKICFFFICCCSTYLIHVLQCWLVTLPFSSGHDRKRKNVNKADERRTKRREERTRVRPRGLASTTEEGTFS